ncbi:uncharacterized protein LOC110833755 [Zootermopsis nevadensis]|uniref:uncharacterized protein LOC110833755 n=1 Tax=Zootermopsis nevadensis TaxID=136037 RepID=UPI000B8E9FAA|nr:uncharacterized protein LOC110833755 [Zootermopsis nevadensis]
MEQTLENVGETQEYDSEDDDDGEGTGKVVCGGGTGVTVELAESSDDEDVKGTWKRGRTQEMQDAVEIVYLEEDSGSTSSSSCKATKQNEGEAADDADAEEEDPDVLYEGVEFPVVGAGNTVDVTGGDKGNSSKTSIGSAVYENVEFHRNTEAVLTTEQRNSDIPVNLEESANCVNEFSSDIYEDVEFVNLMSLPRNPNVIPYSDSGHYDSTHACVLNDDPNRVTEQITEGDEIVDSGRERDKEDEAKSSGQSMPEIESSSELESRAQVDDDGNIKEVLSDVRCHEIDFREY